MTSPDANPAPLDPALAAWLTGGPHDVDGWAPDPPAAELCCHPDLVARLTAVARPVRGTSRAFVAGCPVVHHADGRPIACAWGARELVVRSDRPAGALATGRRVVELDGAWVALDPWAADVAFARATELLRMHVHAAYALAAEAGAWR